MLRNLVAALYLLAQVGMIFYARFVPSTFFSWAPHDSQSEYQVFAKIDGRELTDREIKQRYRISTKGVEPHHIEHLLRQIRRYEETRNSGEIVAVEVKYRVNGGPLLEWRFKIP